MSSLFLPLSLKMPFCDFESEGIWDDRDDRKPYGKRVARARVPSLVGKTALQKKKMSFN